MTAMLGGPAAPAGEGDELEEPLVTSEEEQASSRSCSCSRNEWKQYGAEVRHSVNTMSSKVSIIFCAIVWHSLATDLLGEINNDIVVANMTYALAVLALAYGLSPWLYRLPTGLFVLDCLAEMSGWAWVLFLEVWMESLENGGEGEGEEEEEENGEGGGGDDDDDPTSVYKAWRVAATVFFVVLGVIIMIMTALMMIMTALAPLLLLLMMMMMRRRMILLMVARLA